MPSNITLSKENITFPYPETGYAHKCFPVRNIRRFKPDDGGAWLIEYKIEKERQLDALNRINDKKKVLKSPKKVKEFTGLFLTKEFHLDEPSALFSINISGKQLHSVKDEDFSSFANVLYIEAGDNHLHFETFKSFPNLEELHLQVNGISDIGITHKEFQCLKRLDLSYNHLKDNALLSLGKLRNVKELTLRGCSLTNLPADLARGYLVSHVNNEQHKSKSKQKSRFPQLEHLDLSENKLTDLSTFASLAGLRKLKTLNLSSNKICGIPHLRLLVAHRHFSASTCSQLANAEIAFNGYSVENITKAKEFCKVGNSIGVVAAPSENSSTEVAKDENIRKNEAGDENILKEDCNAKLVIADEHKDRGLNDTNDIISDDSVKDLCEGAFPEKRKGSNSNDSDKNVIDEILINDTIDNTQQLTNIGDPNDINVGEIDTFNTEVDADTSNENIVTENSDIVVSDETDFVDIRISINEVIGEEHATNSPKETDGIAAFVKQEESDAVELTEEESTSDKIVKTKGFCKLGNALEETVTNEITSMGAKDETSTQVIDNIMESIELNEEFEKLMNIEPLEENDALFTTDFAKELNFGLSYKFDEEDLKDINNDTDDNNGDFQNSGEDILNEDDNLHDPYSSLKMLDLSHNLITEEAALLALSSWPVLQDLKVWGNPLMKAFKGIPPVISHHLQKMCGINVHCKLPQENHMHHSIGPSIAKSAKTYRVKTNLPPIKKNNMLMIEAAIQKAVEDSERGKEEPSPVDTNNMQNEDGGESEDHDIKKSSGEEEDYNETEGIFLTQVDEDAEVPAMEQTGTAKQLPEEDEAVNPKYKGYDELLTIDETYGPESDIHIPSTVYGSVQALRQMLKNPLVFKEGNYNRKSRLDPEGQKEKKIRSAPTRKKKEDKISEALEIIRTKETTYQENLATVLDQYTSSTEMKEKFPDAKKIVKRVQGKYDEVRLESLRPISVAQAELSRMSTRADKRSQDLILLRMKQGRIGDLYSSPRNTSTSRKRVTSQNITHSAN